MGNGCSRVSDFQTAIGPLLQREGSQFIANDNGRGSCKWGITRKTAREFYPNCSDDDIARMTPEQAEEFYRMHFWERYQIGRITDQALAERVFDMAVNMGGGTAVKMLQRVVGVKADGILGPHTAAMTNMTQPGEVIGGLKITARRHYEQLAAADPEKYGDDLPGWLNRLERV